MGRAESEESSNRSRVPRTSLGGSEHRPLSVLSLTPIDMTALLLPFLATVLQTPQLPVRPLPTDHFPFHEVPGVAEFSGKLIVHPYSVEAFMGFGFSRRDAEALREAALLMLEPFEVEAGRFRSEEMRLHVPAGVHENEVAGPLLASGLFVHVNPSFVMRGQSASGGDEVPNDPDYVSQSICAPGGQIDGQWNLAMIEAERAWKIHRGQSRIGGAQSDIVIATLDTGVDHDHPDLTGRLVSGFNVAHDLAQSDFPAALQNAAINDWDMFSHGTRVAGVAAALSDNGQFTAGLNWDAAVMPIRVGRIPLGECDYVLYPDVCKCHDPNYVPAPGECDPPDIYEVLQSAEWAVANGARVIASTRALHPQIFSALDCTGSAVRQGGGLLFWAAGNGNQLDPGADPLPNVVVMGGSDDDDGRWGLNKEGLACEGDGGSDYGPFVDLYAPGECIPSIKHNIYSMGLSGCGSGTSFATPHGAGAAALLWSINPDLTPAEVEQALLSTAATIDLTADGSLTGPRLNLGAAAEAVAISIEPLTAVKAGQIASFHISNARADEVFYVARSVDGIDFQFFSALDVWVAPENPVVLGNGSSLWTTDSNGEATIYLAVPHGASELRLQVLQEGAPWGRVSNLLEILL